ncbi:hypothetical protein CRG98_000250 [Punica granatum]|uniref:Uncharacterized protein n=1 Tax=Punica granatum TaxID=22663 RepID=A0A2I0LFA9_PUNGR|nr:hypothetical protein CRG98_000250 [Punica granatum]
MVLLPWLGQTRGLKPYHDPNIVPSQDLKIYVAYHEHSKARRLLTPREIPSLLTPCQPCDFTRISSRLTLTLHGARTGPVSQDLQLSLMERPFSLDTP